MQSFFKYLQTIVAMIFASQVPVKSKELTVGQNPEQFKTLRTVQNSTSTKYWFRIQPVVLSMLQYN